MDLLSATGNITTAVISNCEHYVRAYKDAPKDLRKILIEIGGLKCVLEVLQMSAAHSGPGTHSAVLDVLNGPQGCLSELQSCLKELQNLVRAPRATNKHGKRVKLATSLTDLAWPLKQTKSLKLLEHISNLKGTISLALTAETA
jgi:hypothetical protein